MLARVTCLVLLSTAAAGDEASPSTRAAPLLTAQDADGVSFSPRDAKAAFAVLDTDDSGALSREELSAGLRALQSPITAEELDALFDRARRDGNAGGLRRAEFTALLHEAS